MGPGPNSPNNQNRLPPQQRITRPGLKQVTIQEPEGANGAIKTSLKRQSSGTEELSSAAKIPKIASVSY